MSELKEPITALKEKVELLITSHGQIQARTKALEAENEELKRELELKNQLIKETEEKHNLAILAQSMSSDTQRAEAEDIKLTIANLVQEIDECISLLDKNM